MGLVVLVVMPLEGRYLVVEEKDRSWYLPAGRVEPGENLMAACVRETAEEAGVMIGLRGILAFEHEVRRMRFCFVGYLAVNTPPKSMPDRHTLSAAWKTKAELATMPLRHPEVLAWIERYEAGTPLLPCGSYIPYGLNEQEPWSAALG